MRYIVYTMLLRPLIRRDYGMRQRGTRLDRFHWADRLACSWGYFTNAD